MATYAYYVGVYTYIHVCSTHTYIVHVMYVSAHQSLLYFYLPRHPENIQVMYVCTHSYCTYYYIYVKIHVCVQ